MSSTKSKLYNRKTKGQYGYKPINETDDDKNKKRCSKIFNNIKNISSIIAKYIFCCRKEKPDETQNQQIELNKAMEGHLRLQSASKRGKKTLVLDLDETLVHASYQKINGPDIYFTLNHDNKSTEIYVKKRPYVTEFLSIISKYYEVVVFTASMSNYANPLLNILDKNKFIDQRLYRDHCKQSNNVFVKDLDQLGRNLKDVIIVDNCAASFKNQPENAIHIKSFFFEENDKELLRLLPFLIFMSSVYDVRQISEWFKVFREGVYINYMDMFNVEQVLKKSDFIMDIITYITKNVTKFDDKSKKTSSTKDKSQKGQSKSKDSKDIGNSIVKTIIKTNCIGEEYEDPENQLIFEHDFYINRRCNDDDVLIFNNTINSTNSDSTTLVTERNEEQDESVLLNLNAEDLES